VGLSPDSVCGFGKGTFISAVRRAEFKKDKAIGFS